MKQNIVLVVIALAITASACLSRNSEPPRLPTNVIVVSVDSLRVDRLSPFDSAAVAATPHLAQLAADGVVFTNAWASSPWTAPSMVSIFTGLYPPTHGVVFRDDTTPEHLNTLPRLLASRNYRLGNFSFFSGISYFANLGFPPPERGLRHGHAAVAFRNWLEKEPNTPFLAWIHLIEPHLPYGASGYKSTSVTFPGSSGLERAQLRADVPLGSVSFDDGDREVLTQLYDSDIEDMDNALGSIMQVLEDTGIRDRTLVILVADHGEELFDHGWIGHASTAINAKLVPEILHIPMLFSGPGIPRGVRSEDLVQQVDIVPTICRLLEIGPPQPTEGQAIRFTESSARNDRKTVFFDSSAAGNLTPVERRSERLQAASDGDCLYISHRRPPEISIQFDPMRPGETVCDSFLSSQLATLLARWQDETARNRMMILALGGRELPLSPAEADSFEASLLILNPLPDEVIHHEVAGGHIRIEWEARDDPCWVQYEIGGEAQTIGGVFRADSNPLVVGPFPDAFWNDLTNHNPYRFRIICKSSQEVSQWIKFTLAPVSS